MKLFITKFYQTLVFNIATLSAIVVGILQFAVRSYQKNNGNEKIRKMMQTVLRFLNALIRHLEVVFADPTPVTVSKVAQRRPKRS